MNLFLQELTYKDVKIPAKQPCMPSISKGKEFLSSVSLFKILTAGFHFFIAFINEIDNNVFIDCSDNIISEVKF